ncbi:MAG: hypothetical protein Q7S22_00480 [Candidatus Micrarchaeota archaeon]|nr:hypothetical protein [Candidatus Micrarchaeota archaeon]
MAYLVRVLKSGLRGHDPLSPRRDLFYPQRPRTDPVVENLIRSIKRADIEITSPQDIPPVYMPLARRYYDILVNDINAGQVCRAESIVQELDRIRPLDGHDVKPVLKLLLRDAGVLQYQKFGVPSMAMLSVWGSFALYTGINMGSVTSAILGVVVGGGAIGLAVLKTILPRRISISLKQKEVTRAEMTIDDAAYVQNQATMARFRMYQRFSRIPSF